MCDENMGLCEGTDLDAYFSNYWDNTNTEENQEDAQRDIENTPKEVVINVEEELAKYGDVSNDNDDEDDFEKI